MELVVKKISTGTGDYPSVSALPCQYLSTVLHIHPFIYLSLMLHDLNN
jgi:hypothetical protein